MDKRKKTEFTVISSPGTEQSPAALGKEKADRPTRHCYVTYPRVWVVRLKEVIEGIKH